MKIIYFISLTVFMSVFCIVFLLINADTYTVDITLERPDTSLDDYITDIEQDREIIKISDRYIENNRLYITLESVSEGRAFLNISLKNSDTSYLSAFYVHKGGIITYSEFFGDCTGGGVVKVCICIYLIIIIASLVYLHTKKIRQSLRTSILDAKSMHHTRTWQMHSCRINIRIFKNLIKNVYFNL